MRVFLLPVFFMGCCEEGPVTGSFNVDEERAEQILRNIERALMDDGKCLHDVIREIFEDDEMGEKEKMFSIYAAGFVGGRHLTLNEIANAVGVERLAYLMDGEKNHDDCMYG